MIGSLTQQISLFVFFDDSQEQFEAAGVGEVDGVDAAGSGELFEVDVAVMDADDGLGVLEVFKDDSRRFESEVHTVLVAVVA